ncbi:ChbG/HpnK family deacetylase [Hazenella sp. IB182357]|uniref:ChbG/HpnK family deacetylase n=1 Tax=Polycladospora coralii TaxID=2771432 RepID=A0A926NAR8_9BACL|nr:ChbG/HpnK family deacetylase [Polycladospora coralii]MBD1373028.1 ChbG/HpnK family deacetylase [Polycladospora coralii]
MKYLIVNADDFGLSTQATKGILESYHSGIVTSTTAIVNGRNSALALQQAAETAPRLGVGLHLNLSYGKPLAVAKKGNHLVNTNGYFYTGNELLSRILNFKRDEIRCELEAQMEHFYALTGKWPTHIDFHQHLSSFSFLIYEEMRALADRYQLPMRSHHHLIDKNHYQAFLKRLSSENPQVDFSLFNCNHLPFPIHDTSVFSPQFFEYRFYGSGATLKNMLHTLNHLPNGITEIMCHPVLTKIMTHNQAEMEILQHKQVRQVIEKHQITLMDYTQLSDVDHLK